ncbi:hypothetical protein ACJX0J_023215, partial [Zea mays]
IGVETQNNCNIAVETHMKFLHYFLLQMTNMEELQDKELEDKKGDFLFTSPCQIPENQGGRHSTADPSSMSAVNADNILSDYMEDENIQVPGDGGQDYELLEASLRTRLKSTIHFVMYFALAYPQSNGYNLSSCYLIFIFRRNFIFRRMCFSAHILVFIYNVPLFYYFGSFDLKISHLLDEPSMHAYHKPDFGFAGNLDFIHVNFTDCFAFLDFIASCLRVHIFQKFMVYFSSAIGTSFFPIFILKLPFVVEAFSDLLAFLMLAHNLLKEGQQNKKL